MTIVLHLVDKSKNPQIPPLSQTKLKQILLFYFSPIDLIPKEKKKKENLLWVVDAFLVHDLLWVL